MNAKIEPGTILKEGSIEEMNARISQADALKIAQDQARKRDWLLAMCVSAESCVSYVVNEKTIDSWLDNYNHIQQITHPPTENN